MKKLSIKTLLVVMAGMAVACQMRETEADPAQGTTVRKEKKELRVHFNAVTAETRTAFEEPEVSDGIATYPTLWTENDSQVAISLNYAGAVLADVIPSENFKNADFEGDFSGVETTAPYTFYAVSPASAVEAASASRKALTVVVPADQTPLENHLSPDESAQILFAKSAEMETIPEVLKVNFKHLTAYGRLVLKNLPEDQVVTSVTLVSAEPWAGSWYYNCEEGTMEAKEASSSITIHTDASDAVWFACAPVDLKGKTLKIIANTDTGRLEREITLSGKNVDFSAGHVYKFSVDMAKATFVENKKEVYYELVTDASTLAAGDEVIIANVLDNKMKNYYAMSTTYQSKYRETVAVTVEDNRLQYDPDKGIELFTLENGTTNGSWAFKTTAGNYIAGGGSSKNSMTNNTSKSNASSWRITISGGTATMVSQSGTYTYLLFNYGASPYRYTCYNSTNASNLNQMTKVALYRKVESAAGPAADDPILEQTVFGAYLTNGNTVYTYPRHQQSREYNADGTVTFAILEPVENLIHEFVGIPASAAYGAVFTLTLVEKYGTITRSSTEYPVMVVKEDGAKLWLSDGAGNGFIVKR